MNNCQNCRCYRKITDIKISESVVTLIPQNSNAKPMEAFNWCIQTSYCSPAPTVPVGMILNDEDIPLWDIYGRPVYSNQIKARKVYNARYVEEGEKPHLTVSNVCLEGAMCCRTPTVPPRFQKPPKRDKENKA